MHSKVLVSAGSGGASTLILPPSHSPEERLKEPEEYLKVLKTGTHLGAARRFVAKTPLSPYIACVPGEPPGPNEPLGRRRMELQPGTSFLIGAWRVAPAANEISRDGTVVQLEPRTMRLLVCLAAHPGRVISIQELLDQIWSEVIVTPDSVYQSVAALRRALGDDSNTPSYIDTVPRKGYRLIAEVRALDSTPVPVANQPADASILHAVGHLTTKARAPRWWAAFSIGIVLMGASIAALRWATRDVGAPAAGTSTVIAVLPFQDMSEHKDQAYFAGGMADELINSLAKLPGLSVIGRTSSFQFNSQGADLREIGAKLHAAYIVEGSVRKSLDSVRVTAQLIDAQAGVQRWSGTFDRNSLDLLQVQDEIALNLARALQLTVRNDFLPRPAGRNAEAYDLYLRGLHALDERSEERIEEAAGDFQQALDKDPSFALAALGLAKAYLITGQHGWGPTNLAFRRCRQAVDLATRLDPTLGAAHAVRSEALLVYDWDWAAAGAEVKLAEELGGRMDAMEAAAQLAAVRGDWDEATHIFETALAADPLNPNLLIFLAWSVDLRSGRYTQAEAATRKALELSPHFGSGHWFLGLSLLFQGRLDESLLQMQQETSEDGQFEGTAIVSYAMGKKAESDAALKRAIEENSDWPSAIARIYAFRGEADQAMMWLDRAYSVKDEDLYLIQHDPLLKKLEGDPRFKLFLRKMNLAN